MHFDELQAFVAAARCGGVSKAAAVIHRSQPAVSRRITLLESTVGSPLFERLPQGLALTDAGRVLLPFAESALAAARDGLEAVRGRLGKPTGELRLSVVGTLATRRFVSLLHEFQRRHGGVELHLATARGHEVDERVRAGEAALGLRYFDDPAAGLLVERLYDDPLVVVAAPHHALAKRRTRTPAATLAAERWVVIERDAHGRRSPAARLEQRLAAAGIDATVARVDSLTAQLRLVEAGFGIAYVARSMVADELAAGRLVRLDVPAMRASIPVAAVRRRSGYLSAAAQTLLELMRRRLPAARAARGG